MRFMIQILGFIIFAFLISNIVTKLENLSVELDKNTNVEAKENVYNTTSRNNTYIDKKHIKIKKLLINYFLKLLSNYFFSAEKIFYLIALTVAFTLVTICGCMCICKNTRCIIRCIRRNFSLFSRCCIEIHNFPNNPPSPELIRYQQVDDCQDVYEMTSVS